MQTANAAHVGAAGTARSPADYWKANVRILLACLAVWFICSFGFGIIFVEQMNSIQLGGFKLGFWFAQQGSIYVFMGLIYYYARRMNRLDREFDVHED